MFDIDLLKITLDHHPSTTYAVLNYDILWTSTCSWLLITYTYEKNIQNYSQNKNMKFTNKSTPTKSINLDSID